MLKKIFCGALILGMTATANAAIIYTDWQESKIAEKITEFSNEPASLQKFDTLGGTRELLSVEFDFFGAINSSGTLKNSADGEGRLTSFSVASKFQLLFGTKQLSLLDINAPFDIPFGGMLFEKGKEILLSGDDLKGSNNNPDVYTISDSIFADFIGSGVANFFVNSTTETVIGKTGGNFSDTLQTYASAGVKVRYAYEEITSVSEPGTFAIMGLAIAGLSFSNRKKKSVK